MPEYILNSSAKTVVDFQGSSYLFFGGTNYLGLGYHHDIVMALQEGLIRWGVNTAGSRPTTAGAKIHFDLEKKLSEFLGCESVITTCSGYLTDLLMVQSIAEDFDICVMDERTHVSVRDAVNSNSLKVEFFKHRDSNDLEKQLKKQKKAGKKVLICSDAIFPSSGLLAPLDQYDKLASKHEAMILTNDAHGIGVLGKTGRGSLEHHGIGFDNIFLNGSMSKALGCFGGFSAGQRPLEELIRKRSNVFVGATPLPPAFGVAAITAINIILKDKSLRSKLRENTKLMRNGLKKIGAEFEEAPTPRVAFSFGSRSANLEIHKELMAERILIPYNYYPGGPEDGCFRMIVTARHTDNQISEALQVLEKVINHL